MAEAKRKLEQTKAKTQLSQQDLTSLKSIQRSQEQKDKQYADFYRDKIAALEATKEAAEHENHEKQASIKTKRKGISVQAEELASSTAQVRWEIEKWQGTLAEAEKKYERVQWAVEEINDTMRTKLF